MQIYNSTTISFIKKIKARSLEILSKEAGFEVKRKRILFRGYLYPLEFVVFEDSRENCVLGNYNHSLYQIGINKLFINQFSSEVLDNVLRHELAHFICFLKYGNAVQNHGVEYRTLCKNYQWGEEVYSSKLNLSLEKLKEVKNLDDRKLKVLDKIKKLYSLASSSNINESQLATSKANELLQKYNLDGIESNSEEKDIYLSRVLEAPRLNIKIEVIYEILQYFYVRPVMNKGKGVTYLEVIGEKLNVELAGYTAQFLELEFERFWELCKKENPHLKGKVAKNSYIRGLAAGFIEKVKPKAKAENSKELLRLSNELDLMVEKVYPRMRSSRVNDKKTCNDSIKLGHADAKNFHIRPGLKNKAKTFSLGFFKS
tara:strand:- start:219143 stop:220255 length:1113 start_codon:yes stop_codon:yes gene_type:complete